MKAVRNHLLATALGGVSAAACLGGALPALAEGTVRVDEIVVTAQKRAQRMQDVPISVGAITADAAQRRGIDDTTTLQFAVPGLVVNHTANEGNFFIRGVGTNLFGPSSEQTVAMYVDGVYHPAPEANMFSFNNIERVEVLKGPQGTLFGRNTTGGVVHIITKTPSAERQGQVSVGYANYQTLSASGYISGALSDQVTADLALTYEDQGEGWGKNLTTGLDNGVMADDNFAARSKVVAQLGDATTAQLSADYSYSRLKYDYQLLPGIVGVDGVSTNPGEYNAVGGLDDHEAVKSGGGALELRHDFGAVNLVSITSYRRSTIDYLLDQDDTPIAVGDLSLPSKARSFSQELRLHSAEDAGIQWVVGGFYFNSRASYTPMDVNAGVVVIEDTQKTESFAGFGQATAELADNLNLTLGARYTTEDQDLVIDSFTVGGAPIPLPDDDQSFDKFTYRAALDYRFTDDVMGYVSMNRGFKSGGYNLLAPDTAPFKPEVLDAYELGLKSEWFDSRLRLNLATFLYEYKDIQVTIPQQGSIITVNAARAKIKGVEAEIQAVPVANLNLTAGISYLDGQYTSYPNALVVGPNGESTDANGDPLTVDAKGNRTIATPQITASFSADYLIETEAGGFRPAVSINYNDGYYFYADNRLRQPVYWLINASITWTSPDDSFDVRLWGKNLSDETYYAGMSEQAGLGDAWRQAAPRTYGLTVSARF